MRVLFYVEPVVFRQKPAFLKPWTDWIENIAAANPEHQFAVASGHWLCDDLTSRSKIKTFMITASQALRAKQFQRLRYVKDLFDPPPGCNIELDKRLKEIAMAERPDIVVSFTENSHLQTAFSQARILFTELGCAPRLGAPETFFLDPYGHQTGMLNCEWPRISTMEPPLSIDRSETLWQARLETHIQKHPVHDAIRDWIRTFGGRRIRLLALQPPDWLTYEGVYGAVRPEEIIYEEAFNEPDAVLVPTYHAGHSLGAEMESYIAREFPNVAFAPVNFSTGVTELFVPYVDEVVTISSSVGMAGVLAGKNVRTLGVPAFARPAAAMTLAKDDSTEVARLRRNLLAFLSNRYLYVKRRCTHEAGYYGSAIEPLKSSSALNYYFDFSDWTIARLEAILGLA